MEKNVHTVKVSDLPTDRILRKKLYVKPYTAIYIVLAVGILMVVTRSSVWILGLIMIALSLFGLFFVNDHLQMEICDDYAVLYSESHPDTCDIIRWSEVAEWGIKHEAAGDFLSVRYKDGTMLRSPINNSGAVYRALNNCMHEMETSYLVQKRINAKRNEPSKFKWPWQRKKK